MELLIGNSTSGHLIAVLKVIPGLINEVSWQRCQKASYINASDLVNLLLGA